MIEEIFALCGVAGVGRRGWVRLEEIPFHLGITFQYG